MARGCGEGGSDSEEAFNWVLVVVIGRVHEAE
jgi:hypothetical protein